MRKLLIPAAVIVAALGLFSFKKAQQYSKVLDNLQINVLDIAALKMDFSKIDFKIKLDLFNPTDEVLNASTLGLAYVKNVFIYRAGNLIATAAVNQSSIEIPANGSYTTDWIDVELPLSVAVNNITSLIGNSFNANDLEYKVEIAIKGLGTQIIG